MVSIQQELQQAIQVIERLRDAASGGGNDLTQLRRNLTLLKDSLKEFNLSGGQNLETIVNQLDRIGERSKNLAIAGQFPIDKVVAFHTALQVVKNDLVQIAAINAQNKAQGQGSGGPPFGGLTTSQLDSQANRTGVYSGFIGTTSNITYGKVSLYQSEDAARFRSIAKEINDYAQRQAKWEQVVTRELQHQMRIGQRIAEQKARETGVLQEDLGEFAGRGSPYLDSAATQEKLTKALESYGLTLGDITSVEKDRVSGITRVTAATTDLSGRTETANLTISRLGEVTASSGGGFRNLANEVSRSVAQFAKFMVSATLVYGILNVISEQTQVVVDNQTELATIAVILGNNQERLAQVYSSAAEAADVAAESINGVLEGYQQAIRATGNVANETERLRQANVFMTESLVLSKLSTLDQAKSMDILVAVLRQTGIEIDDARNLLDRWVAVTKIANVDMRTLAESYAIVATVAESAGIEIEEANNELVGLIAVLAEQTQLTPTETGNALRAVITGLNTDIAIDQLRNFGIAVTDVNGDMRDFLDIATEINLAWQEGLITDAQLSRISRSIGGGVRRQAQVEIVLKGLDRAFQINKESANQYGSAEDALAIQTDTLRDSITRLSNAFQELAQTLGTDGGFLELITDLVSGLTKLIRLVDSLANKVGGSAIGILAAGATSLFARGRQRLPFERAAYGLDDYFTSPRSPTRFASVQNFGRLTGATYGQVGAAAITGGVLGVGIPAATNFLRGENEQGAANIIGGTIGGAIGAYLGGPPGLAIGATIGSAVGESFVNSVLTLEGDVVEGFRAVLLDPTGEPTGGVGREREEEVDPVTADDILEALGRAAIAERGGYTLSEVGISGEEGVSDRVARRRGGFEAFTRRIGGDILGFIEGTGLLEGGEPGSFREEARTRVEEDRAAENTLQEALYDLRREDIEAFNDLIEQQPQLRELIEGIGGGVEGIPDTAYFTRGREISGENISQIVQIQESLTEELFQKMLSGELSFKQIEERTDTLGGFESFVSSIFPGLETADEGFIQIGEDLLTTSEALGVFADILSYARQDEIDQIVTFASKVRESSNALEELRNSGDATERELTDMEKVVAEDSAALVEHTGAVYAATQVRQYEVPGLVELPGEFAPGGLQEFINRLVPAQEAFEEAQYRDPFALEDYREGLGPITLRTGQEYVDLQELTGLDRGFDPSIVSRILQELAKEEGFFTGGEQQNPAFLQLPFPSTSPLRQEVLGPGYGQFANFLEKNFGYQEQIASNIAIYSDKQFELVQRDNTIIQFLLSQIEENTSDVVDGIYNLPQDGTFFVPYAAYAFGAGNLGGGTGGLDLSELGVIGDALEESRQEQADQITPDAMEELGNALLRGTSFLDSTDREFTEESRDIPEWLLTAPERIYRPYVQRPGGDVPRQAEGESLEEFAQRIENLIPLPNNPNYAPPTPGFDDRQQATNIGEAVANSLLGAELSVPPINLTVDMTATFETFLDGQVIANIVKRFLTEEIVRKGPSTGNTVAAVI